MGTLRTCAAAALMLLSLAARGEGGAGLLERLKPSLVVVTSLDAAGRAIAQGSGVALGPGQVITNCHVGARGASLQVRQANASLPALIQYSDTPRDLCQLSVPGLAAPEVALGSSRALAVGQPVFALGAPGGQDFLLSEGVVSALRQHDGSNYIQTSAAIQPGSSGGGLFDREGRLVGITTFFLSGNKRLNFALPSDWIAELPDRTQSPSKTGKGGVAWLNRALALEEKKDWEALLEHAQQWMERAPEEAAFFLAEAFGGLRQYDSAIAAYREAVRLRPDDADAWFNLGVSLGVLKRHAEAIESYEQVRRIDPQRSDAPYNLGHAYSELRLFDRAVAVYQEALKLSPGHADAWINLGVSLGRTRQFDAAVHAYHEALRLQPDSADVWYNLGVAYYRQGQIAKVREILPTLRKLDPDLADNYVRLMLPPER